MICLADNDYILKLAACDLLAETLALLDLEQGDVYVLPTAKYKIAKDKRLQAKFGAGAERALAFLKTVSEIDSEPDKQEMVLLNGVRDPATGVRLIHEGEQVLFAVTQALNDFLFATGDKVCLRALTNAPECLDIHVRHCGHVVCVEQTLLWLIETEGFERVKAKVVPAISCDTALRAAFGSGMAANCESVVHALNSYVEEIAVETAGLIKRTL